MSLLEIAENLDLADKRLVTDFSAKSSFHCIPITNFPDQKSETELINIIQIELLCMLRYGQNFRLKVWQKETCLELPDHHSIHNCSDGILASIWSPWPLPGSSIRLTLPEAASQQHYSPKLSFKANSSSTFKQDSSLRWRVTKMMMSIWLVRWRWQGGN